MTITIINNDNADNNNNKNKYNIYIYMDIHTQSYAYSKPKLFSGGLPEYPNLIWLISSFDSAKNLGLYCS